MNKEITSRHIDEPTPEPRLLSLARPWTGALIGILVFLLVVVIFRLTNLFTAFIVLVSPGVLTGWIIIPKTIAWSTSLTAKLINYSVVVGISAIPPGILGSLIASDEKEIRSKGIVISIIYLIFLLIVGIPISTVFD